MSDTDASQERSPSLHAAARQLGVPFSREAGPVDRYAHANGLRLHYLDWGETGARPLLMLHGMAQTAHSWDFAALALCDRFRVIALDQRGHGDSDWAPDGDYSLHAHQGDVEAFVQALGLRGVVLVGLSMGGRNACAFAADHPDEVAALVVVDWAPEHQRSGAAAIRRFVQAQDVGSFDEFAERVRTHNPRRTEAQIRASLAHNLKQLPDGKWTWKYDAALRSPAAGAPGRPELTGQLWGYVEGVECPALLVRGAASEVLSHETAVEMVARLPDGRLAEIEDAGHTVPGDNPAGFHRAVETFLDSLDL